MRVTPLSSVTIIPGRIPELPRVAVVVDRRDDHPAIARLGEPDVGPELPDAERHGAERERDDGDPDGDP